jgi:phosphatidylinositol glycan class B
MPLASAVRRCALPTALPNERRLALIAMGGLVILTIVLRLVPLVFVPSINWWDEIFQSTEQAHRLVYGYGLIPWEFQLGVHSWLLPAAVAGLMEFARLFGDGPDYYLPLIAIACGALAAAPVVCCFQWCRRSFGLTGGLIGGLVVAVAPELVYFGARTLSEVITAHLLVIAVYLVFPGYRVESRRRLFAAGVLLGLVCLVRVQLAPAVAVIALWPASGAWPARRAALLTGALTIVLCGAALDWVTLGEPLASIWRYIGYNLYYGVSSDFGTEPWNYYLLGELGLWRGAMIFLLLAAGLGARRMPVLLAATVVIIVSHSVIAHKEYRFLYPAILTFTILAGIGMAQLALWMEQSLGRRGLDRRIAAAASSIIVLVYWGNFSFHVWTGSVMTALRYRMHDHLLAASFAGHMPGLCGIGMYGEQGRDWVKYGGYTYLNRPVPIFWPEDRRELVAAAPAFNTLFYTMSPPRELGFKAIRCFGRVCVAHRSGRCDAQPMPAMPFPKPLAGLAPAREDFKALPDRLAPPRTALGAP